MNTRDLCSPTIPPVCWSALPCRAEDSVLIMDTARFKHPPHWAPLPMLWEAMKTLDPETGKPRGYMVLEKAHNLSHRLFTANSANYKDWPQVDKKDKRFLNRFAYSVFIPPISALHLIHMQYVLQSQSGQLVYTVT